MGFITRRVPSDFATIQKDGIHRAIALVPFVTKTYCITYILVVGFGKSDSRAFGSKNGSRSLAG
jgi:hypothetical protein